MTASGILMREFVDAASVTEDADLQAVIDRLANCEAGAIVVLSGSGQLAGVISDRDLVRALSTRGRGSQPLVARDIMTPEVTTCGPDQTDLELLLVMAEKRIRHLPVVIGEHVIGMITIDEAVRRRLTKVGHLTQQVALEADHEKRLRLLDQHASETADMFAVFRALASVEDQVGLEGLDVRARQMLVQVGDAARSGTPFLVRDFMKFHRWGAYSTVRKLLRQLEDGGLVTCEPTDEEATPRRQRVQLTDAGREVLNQMASSVARSLAAPA